MNRATVYNVIKKERDYQDMNWPRDNPPLVAQYRYAAPHILMIEDYARKAQALWTKSKDEVDVLQTIAKLATIAVRALEETVDGSGHQMDRYEIFLAIDSERASQDLKHPRTKDNAGQYKFSAPPPALSRGVCGQGKEPVEGRRPGWCPPDIRGACGHPRAGDGRD